MIHHKARSLVIRPTFPTKTPARIVGYYILLVFSIISIYSSHIHAREWYVEPYASSQLIFDNNLQLRPDRTITTNGVTRELKPENVFGGTLQAGGTIGSQTETSDINVRGNVSFNRYTISNFNSVNFFLHPETWFTVSPRDKFGISGKLFFDTTLSRERPIDGTPQNLDETDDLLGVPRRRFLKSIRPEWNHSLTEKTALNLSYEFTDVTYENASKTGRLDYEIHTGQLNLSHQLTPKILIFSNTSATLFSTPDADSSTTYYSLQLGGNYKLSERWEAEAALGGRYSISESKFQRIVPILDSNGNLITNANGDIAGKLISEKNKSSGLGSLAYASLTHHYANGQLKASVTQDIRPTGNGNLQASNQAAFNWSHKLSEHLTLSLPLSFLRGSALDSDSNSLDRTYYQAAPILRWRLSPELSLGLRYRYRYQKYDNANDSADSHGAMLSANYNWRRSSFSR